MEKFVVTSEDLAGVSPAPMLTPSAPPVQLPPAIPLWLRMALSPLVLVLPVLCLTAIVLRVALLNKAPRTRYAWDAYLCTLLVISGVLFTGAMAVVVSTGVGTVPVSKGLVSFDEKTEFPSLPAVENLTGREVSSKLKPLVVIASPQRKGWFSKTQAPSGSMGTAFLLQANAEGYLFATARHVVDGQGLNAKLVEAREMLLSTIDGGWSGAVVVARHAIRDVALVWVPRREGKSSFCQPVLNAKEVNAGDTVFVIGHPEGLYFSLSTGIVSRIPGDRTLQISAPISPGNSGGPVYDPHGVLVGIVSYTFNKAMAPNAENLNFAVDADVLLDTQGWLYEDKGPEKLASFQKNCATPP
ncbi:MAG TPA: serine protease, partial [Terriglobales bacterium]|nr:serine protease [Terriglobales bacterium]